MQHCLFCLVPYSGGRKVPKPSVTVGAHRPEPAASSTEPPAWCRAGRDKEPWGDPL